MRIFKILFVSLALLSQQVAFAAPEADSLGICLKDNTSGKDRKELARWIFVALSVHPEIRSLTTATDETRREANQRMAALVTRLLTENCTDQTRVALAQNGGQGLVNAFRSLGEVATMELMTDKDVAASITGYTEFLDKKKFEQLIAPQPAK